MIVSRTGYTGDLGYELWFGAEHAERVWDVLMEKGDAYGIKAAGLLALDVARLEAGFILLEVDYIGAEKAVIPTQRHSPFDIGLGWTVDLHKDHFIGAKALREMNEVGPTRQIVGIGNQSRRLRISIQAGRLGAALSTRRLARRRASFQR